MQNVSLHSDWFKTWFDSPYYHQLYKDRNDEEARKFLNNLIQHVEAKKGDAILDLACGRGRHSRYLNSLGFKVTGADLSHASISWAKQFENESLEFLEHDMRKVIEGRSFHCIFNLFTSFGYFDHKRDNLEVLRSMNKMLDKHGTAVIDFLNVKKIIHNLVKEEVKTVDGLKFSINRHVEDGIIIKEISFKDKGSRFHFYEEVQAFDLHDFKSMLSETGFTIKRIFGSYNLTTFDEERSDRLIFIANKSQEC